ARCERRTSPEARVGTDPAGFASATAASHNDQSREGILESQPHDNVHGAMGGATGNAFMVSFLSPVDPIFFLHHANLDRLWDVWTRRQAALGRPTLPQGADLATWSKRAVPVLQRSEQPAGGEDQRRRLRRDERLRLRLFTGFGRGSGAGARDSRGGSAGDAGFQRPDHLRDDPPQPLGSRYPPRPPPR